MSSSSAKGKVLRIVVLSLLVVMALPLGVFGQGRGRGRDHGLGKKCAKFVNCHDASEGRVDGRGPRRDGFGSIFRRDRRRRDNDDFGNLQRRRHRNDDFLRRNSSRNWRRGR